ncbi:hypothetical protein B0H17DRAFT_1199936 [Mycena rosella]|uniref:DUF6534 domain-containing protein n=1 Tax=Mycena rosella TaxID=1033263 RepID=A0AAD7DJX5_MYCRO|nr:hypothetical protein B0H17DRAFT_1199936 [Mycena rosella]
MSAANPFSALPNGVDISSHVDAMFVGIMFSFILWGVTVPQTWNYFNSNKDGWMLQALVGVLFVLDSVSTYLTGDMAHVYLVQNFGNLAALATVPTSAIAEVAINVAVCFLVQLFFARRVHLLNQRRLIMPIIIVLFAAAGVVAGIFIVVDISKSQFVASLASPRMKVEVALTNAFQAMADLTATCAMSYEFYTNRGSIKSTNTLLEKLLAVTVARGGLVTVAQFVTLALYVAQPTTLNWMPAHFTLGKLSHITMILILNSRESLRAKVLNDSMLTDTVMGGRQLSSNFQLRTLDRPEGKTTMGGIQVRQEKITEYDEQYEPVARKQHHQV